MKPILKPDPEHHKTLCFLKDLLTHSALEMYTRFDIPKQYRPDKKMGQIKKHLNKYGFVITDEDARTIKH